MRSELNNIAQKAQRLYIQSNRTLYVAVCPLARTKQVGTPKQIIAIIVMSPLAKVTTFLTHQHCTTLHMLRFNGIALDRWKCVFVEE